MGTKRFGLSRLIEHFIVPATCLALSGCSGIHSSFAPVPAESVSPRYAFARTSSALNSDDLKIVALARAFQNETKLALCELFYISGPAEKEGDFMKAIIDPNSHIELKVPSGGTVRVSTAFAPVFPIASNAAIWTADPREILLNADLVPQKPICIQTTEEWRSEFEHADILIRLVHTTYIRVPTIIIYHR
jgi:hypothetical protein